LNSYFFKKRAKAAGYALTICGLGLIIMPQVYSFLLYSYGVKGAVTIVAALASHTFVSSLLLQPIKWHMKEELVEDDKDKIENEKLLNQEAGAKIPYSKEQREQSVLSLEQEVQAEIPYNSCAPLTRSLLALHHGSRESTAATSLRRQLTLPIFPKEIELKEMELFVREKQKVIEKKITEENQQESKIKKKKFSILKRIGKGIVDMFDLTLLQSPTFVNMMIGMSFAVFAEMNFTILTPFIMQDFGLDTYQIATFMSTISVADICFRFIAPYVSDYFQKPARVMYMWALILLILSRS
ncbi:membrane transporter, partial [Oryctes borbonicus]